MVNMSSQKPETYTIVSARGRHTANPTREPALVALELLGPDGHTIAASLPQDGRKVQTHYDVLLEAERHVFDQCPVCLSPAPTEKEHVPPRSIGGTSMTKTCEPCNNTFGHRFEEPLRIWWEYEFSRFAVEHPAVRGKRKVTRVRLREVSSDDDPQFMILMDLPEGQGFREAFASGVPFDLHYDKPDPARWTWAALKSAYIGACLLLGQIIDTPEAEAVRNALVAARDADIRTLEPQRFAKIARIDRESSPGKIQLVRTWTDDGGPSEFGVLLSDVLYVSWTFGGYLAAWDTETDEGWAISLDSPGAS